MQHHGMMGGGMMSGTMMMCHPMAMLGLRMGGMMGTMTVPDGDPKAAARALLLRADMLKAMSEVLQRHAAERDKAP